MPDSLASVFIHIVFATKHRHPWLSDPETRQELYRFLAGTCQRLGSPSLAIGGVEDHVHLAVRLSRTSSLADLLQELKQESSKWIKQRFSDMTSFYWQTGYGAFSVSSTHLPRLKTYIANQESHHHRESFASEMDRLQQLASMSQPPSPSRSR